MGNEMGNGIGNEMEMHKQTFEKAVDQLFVVDTAYIAQEQATPEERAVLDAQKRESRKTNEAMRRESKEKALAAFKSLSQVQTAQKDAAYDKSFPEKAAAKNMSASKRMTRSRMRFSALHEKAVVGDQLTAYANEVEHEKAEKVEAYKARIRTLDTTRMKPELLESLAYNTEGSEEEAITSVTTKLQGSKAEKLEAVNDCVRRFMKIDPDGIDVSSDKAFAQSQGKLEYITRQFDAISEILLVTGEGTYKDAISPEAYALFSKKLNTCKHLAAYYRAQMEVLTDITYRMSYNSEISKNFRETDAPEKKVLTHKLAIAADAYEKLTGKKRLMPIPPNTPEENAKDAELRSKLSVSIGEYGKNVDIDKKNPLYYFTQNLKEDPAAVEVLQQEHYHISGDTITMSESLFRRLDNLAQLKVVQRMDKQTLQTMVEQLKMRPANPENPESVAEARRNNIEGMRTYKRIVEKQIDYLNRKYGLGIMNLTLEEINAHREDFDNDFANMQGLATFLDYASTIPELRGADDQNYMNRCCFYMNFLSAENASKIMFMMGSFSQKEYYRDRCGNLAQDRRIMAGMSSLNHTDGSIVWSEQADLGRMDVEDAAKLFRDSTAVYQKMTMMLDINPEATLEWYHLVPNLAACTSSDEAMTALIDEMRARAREALNEEYHQRGYENPGACICGIGSDDLGVRNEILLKWRDHPEILRQKGLDDEAIAKYEGFMKQWDVVGKEMFYYATLSSLMEPLIMNYATAKKPEEQLSREFFLCLERHDHQLTNELVEYSQKATSQLNIDFEAFMVEHNLFFKEGHSEIFTEKVVPDARQSVELKKELHVGNQVYYTGEHQHIFPWTDIAEICDGKQLKEGVSPEDFSELLTRYNEELRLITYIQPGVAEMMNDDLCFLKEDKGEFWRKYIKGSETGWFANGLYMQLMTRIDRCKDMSEQMKKMF